MTENHARVREMLAESGVGGDGSEELLECLAELESYVDDEPPQPSPELAALFGSLADNVVTAPFGHRRSRMFLAGVVAIGAVGAGGTAAAANVLPDGAQTIVAELSEKYLPFGLPYPDGTRQPHTVTDEPDPALDPEDLARRAEEAANGGATDPDAQVDTTAPAPTPPAETSTAPSPSATATESAAVPSEQPSPSASDAQTTEPTPSAGEPSASPDGEKTDDGTGTEPTTSPSPSGSSDPSPTANTRNEASEEPSPTGSAAPSGSASPVAAPTAAWTDAG